MTGSTDLNSATTTTTFDNIGRKTLVQVGAAIRDTNFIYNEPACTGTPCVVTSQTPVTVTTYRDLASTNDKGVVEISTLDQRGQTYLTQKSDTSAATFIYVETLPKLSTLSGQAYEAVSNPYRSPDGTIASSTDTTLGWTRTIYDQMNRPIEIDHFDAATLPPPWGSATSWADPRDNSSMKRKDDSGSVRTVRKNGQIEWKDKDGKRHREDGPAFEWPEKGGRAWYIHGKLHREDGPAMDGPLGKSWYLKGRKHREDGPAVEWADGRKEWYRHGEELTEAEFAALAEVRHD